MTETPQRLKQLRKEKDITLKEMSKVVGINISTISNYENGYSIPKPDKLKVLAEFYNVSESYLLGYSNFKNGTEYYNRKVKQIDEDEEKEYDEEESNYDDEYFEQKRFIISVESELIDEIGEEKLSIIKQGFTDSLGTGNDFENVYADKLEVFLKLGLSAERHGYELTDFEKGLLDININFHLLDDENRDELIEFQNFLLYKQDKKKKNI